MAASSGATFDLAIGAVRNDHEWRRWQAQARVQLSGSLPEPAPWGRGDEIETWLRLRLDRPPANPGSSAPDRLRAQSIDLRGRLKSARQVVVLADAGPFEHTLRRLRSGLRTTAEDLFGSHSGWVRALLLGERSDL